MRALKLLAQHPQQAAQQAAQQQAGGTAGMVQAEPVAAR